MTQASLTRSIRRALTQTLRENRDGVRDLLAEILEDVGLTYAIERGRKSKHVNRARIMRALTGRR